MRRIFLILLLTASLALFGCINPPDKGGELLTPEPEEAQNTTLQPLPAEPCAGYENVLKSDECYLNLAAASQNFSICDKIYSISTRDECLIPFSKTDASLCGQLSSPSKKNDCYEIAALTLNSTDYCVKISDATRKQSCLESISPPCSFEQTEKATRLCLANLNNDSSFCKSNECVFDMAAKNSNLGACEQIPQNERALYLACKALASDDISICEQFNLSIVADYCYQIAAYKANNSEWCSLAKEGSPYANSCYAHFAYLQGSPFLCRNAAPEVERDNCYMNYSISTGNYSVCTKVINSLLRSQCYFEVAFDNGDLRACNALGTARTNCYNLVITGSVPIKSIESCHEVIDVQPWQYRCYMRLASEQNNRSICDFITDEKYRDDCNFKFN